MSMNILPARIVKSHWDAVEKGARSARRMPDRSTWRIAREIYVAETTAQARKEALEGVLSRDLRAVLSPSLDQDESPGPGQG